MSITDVHYVDVGLNCRGAYCTSFPLPPLPAPMWFCVRPSIFLLLEGEIDMRKRFCTCRSSYGHLRAYPPKYADYHVVIREPIHIFVKRKQNDEKGCSIHTGCVPSFCLDAHSSYASPDVPYFDRFAWRPSLTVQSRGAQTIVGTWKSSHGGEGKERVITDRHA